jgi:hypothetical protein
MLWLIFYVDVWYVIANLENGQRAGYLSAFLGVLHAVA